MDNHKFSKKRRNFSDLRLKFLDGHFNRIEI